MSSKTFVLFFIATLLLIAVTIINRISFVKMKSYTQEVNHSGEIITILSQLSAHLKSAQIFTPTYKNIPEFSFYDLYEKEANQIDSEILMLKTLAQNDSVQSNNASTIDRLIQRQMPVLKQKNIVEMIQAGESYRLYRLFQIHQHINNSVDYEKKILKSKKADLEESIQKTNSLTIILSIISIALILANLISNLVLMKKGNWLEKSLASVLNSSLNGIISLRAVRKNNFITDFKVEFANAAIEKHLGLKPSQLIDKDLSGLNPVLRNNNLYRNYIDVLENGVQKQFEHFAKIGGEEKWFIVLLARKADGLTATFHDITHLKMIEAELKGKIEQLEHSNNELEQYAYVASHDLQEPLRKIMAYGSYLKEKEKVQMNEKTQFYIDKIINSTRRMSSLISDILHFSALKKENEFQNVDLNKVLENVLNDLDLVIIEKNAKIYRSELPVIEAIPLQMNQLFYNLINNSLKFSRAGVHPTISITAREVSDDEANLIKMNQPVSQYISLIFRDNGKGFDQLYADQIFDLFKRLHGTNEYPGSGIGLALCKKVVQNHNGHILARGEENNGAEFQVILPERQEFIIANVIKKKDEMTLNNN
jgi:signal transduction histidine kinase